MPEYEMPVEEQLKILVKKFTAFEVAIHERFDAVDARLDKVEVRLDRVEKRLDRVEIHLDETHDIAKLGLETVEGLRDPMSQKFTAMEKKQNQEIDLLKSVVVHVRKRVDVEQSARRRRS